MSALVASELLKLRTTRTAFWLIAAMLVLVTAATVLTIIATRFEEAGFDAGSEDSMRSFASNAGNVDIFVLVLGILGFAGEYRHGTISSTFLVAPRRLRVVASKLIAYALAGLTLGIVAVAVALAIPLAWLAVEGIDVRISTGDLFVLALGTVLATACTGAFGTAFAAIFRNQVGAIVAALVLLFVVEPVLSLVLFALDRDEIARFLVSSAAASLAGERPSEEALSMWEGGLVYAAYVAALAAAGAVLVTRRDVT
jgi:ABC-2 type transport system permease protein